MELFYRQRSDNLLAPIEDRFQLLGSRTGSASIDFFLGGALQEEDGRQFYSPALTLHLQRIVDGQVDPVIYLRVFPTVFTNPRTPARVFLNTTDGDPLAARLRVTFTELD